MLALWGSRVGTRLKAIDQRITAMRRASHTIAIVDSTTYSRKITAKNEPALDDRHTRLTGDVSKAQQSIEQQSKSSPRVRIEKTWAPLDQTPRGSLYLLERHQTWASSAAGAAAARPRPHRKIPTGSSTRIQSRRAAPKPQQYKERPAASASRFTLDI